MDYDLKSDTQSGRLGLLGLPATELAAGIRRGEISPRELTEKALKRAETLQKSLNLFTYIARTEALERADWAERELASGRSLGLLHGVPYTLKDFIPAEGYPLTYGSKIFRGNVSKFDSVCAKRLKDAGGVLLGITTSPEMGHKAMTDSPLYGTTRNPWDLSRTPGGSSGGGAAAVAAGVGPLAFGTDGAGSVRIPAACCGVVGIKPTLGAIPRDYDQDAFNQLSHTGVMSRTVADTALAMSVVVGPHPDDPHSSGSHRGDYLRAAMPIGDLRGIRVLFLSNVGNSAVDDETLSLTVQSVDAIRSLGAFVEERSVDLKKSADLLFVLNPASSFDSFGSMLAERGDEFDPSFKVAIEWGRDISGQDLQRAIHGRTDIFRIVQKLLRDFDFIVTPALTTPAVPVTTTAWQKIVIDGVEYGTGRYDWFCYLHPFNHSGNPAISVPIGWTEQGLPVGLQIVGRWHADAEVLRVAAELETIRPWAYRWPEV